jgi:hypothetical protein
MVSPGMVGDLWYSKRRHYFCGAEDSSVGRLALRGVNDPCIAENSRA